MIKWQVYAAQSMKNQWAQGGPLGSLLYGEVNEEVMDEEQDSLKEAMLDTNPYLLGMTFIVSVVHSIFEFLAFKNGLSEIIQKQTVPELIFKNVCRHSVLAPERIIGGSFGSFRLLQRISIFNCFAVCARQ